MSLATWLAAFRDLHERARKGSLGEAELAGYRAGRDELARALLAAQRLNLRPNEAPRRAIRVNRALQVDIEFPDGNVRAMTLDVSAGGFGALVAKQPASTGPVRVSMRVPGGEPVTAEATVIDCRRQPGNVRVSFAFRDLSEEHAERLEMFVFDVVLAQLAS